uniref:Uncharacterized protein n=1 Tax=uncultured marine virus TaxID=186617 RepID=A0A0F7L9V6_9VIRU|nr:hypothetical protein [uncultured marine virus]
MRPAPGLKCSGICLSAWYCIATRLALLLALLCDRVSSFGLKFVRVLIVIPPVVLPVMPPPRTYRRRSETVPRRASIPSRRWFPAE